MWFYFLIYKTLTVKKVYYLLIDIYIKSSENSFMPSSLIWSKDKEKYFIIQL